MTDHQTLLAQYVQSGSNAAFRELVTGYVDLVYSTALRLVEGDTHHAEDVGQNVFVDLARLARTLPKDVRLGGWLHRHTRFVAATLMRGERRRQSRERQAAEMNALQNHSEADFSQVAPILDEAINELDEADRTAILLRFFEQYDFRAVGQALGSNEDAARKRVSRALEKLEEFLMRRGVTTTAASLGVVLTANAVQAAPAGLAVTISAAALAATSLTPPVTAMTSAFIRSLAAHAGKALLIAVLVGLAVLFLKREHNPRITAGGRDTATDSQLRDESPPDVRGAADQPSAVTNTSQGLLFRVIRSDTGAPLSKTRLTLVWSPDSPTHTTNVVSTDRQGTASLPLDRTAGKDWSYRIEVFRDGFVPKYVSWSERQGDEPKDIPTEYITKLTPAVTIGATVVAETGEPIPGARVVFDVPKYGSPAESLDRERLTITREYHVEVADSQGRWQCSHVPSEFGQIMFKVAHSEYAPRQFGSAALGATTSLGIAYLPQADLRNETAVMMLAHGAAAAGVVVDEAGAPVPGAKVTLDHEWAEPTASQITGADGRFGFTNIAREIPGASANSTCYLTVQAEGYAPADFTFQGSVPPEESRLSITNGAELRGRVVDDFGHPVPKAMIQICSQWNIKRFEWSTVTDAEGRFAWSAAPPKPELYVVSASGYQPMDAVKLTPDGKECLITLRTNPPPALVLGTVVDASSRKPIEHFQVWMSFTEKTYTGYVEPMEDLPRPPRLRAVGENGAFSFTNHDPVVAYTLEARADGYRTVEKRNQGPITNGTTCDFQLEPATLLTGEVHSLDGAPVAKATVMLPTDQKGVYMKLPGQFDLRSSGASRVETDAQGRFAATPSGNVKNILIAAPEGFASVTPKELAASPIVTLQPWGCVVGVLKFGDKAGANETIDLSAPHSFQRTGCSLHRDTKTDETGRFVFHGLPPWNLRLSHRPSFPNRLIAGNEVPANLPTQIAVVAGQTNFVTLGGTGCKVVGRVKLPSGQPNRPIDWQHNVQKLSTPLTGLPPRPNLDALSPAERTAAWEKSVEEMREFWQSEAGQEAERNQKRHVLIFDTDGLFRIDDVVPGTYELELRLTIPAVAYDETIGTLSKEITIPESNSQNPGTIDLGTLELQSPPTRADPEPEQGAK